MTIHIESTEDTVIWKYQLQPGRNALQLPAGTQILFAGEQHGGLVCWVHLDRRLAAVHPEDNEFRYVVVTGTGLGFPPGDLKFIGTVQASDGLVWHVAEEARA